jgi:hypothetical protein
MLETGPLTLRIAGNGDGAALRRLAELDSRPLPPGPHLVAEREGRIDAALSLSCGEAVADPFRRTAELCELLRHHAASRAVSPNRRCAGLRPRPILDAA